MLHTKLKQIISGTLITINDQGLCYHSYEWPIIWQVNMWWWLLSSFLPLNIKKRHTVPLKLRGTTWFLWNSAAHKRHSIDPLKLMYLCIYIQMPMLFKIVVHVFYCKSKFITFNQKRNVRKFTHSLTALLNAKERLQVYLI